ncbi:MAG: type II secretion system F family protein [Bacillota bacterium]
MQPILISILIAVFIYSFITILTPVSNEEILKRRVKKFFDINLEDNLYDQVIRDRHGDHSVKNLKNIKLISKEFSEAIAMSGIKLTPKEFFYLWIVTSIVPVILASIVVNQIFTVIAVGFIGILAPPLLLQRARKKRQELFTKQLGEALIIIGNCLKGGFSIQQAMDSINNDMMPPISTEFGIAVRELKLGLSLEETFGHMSARIKNRDFDLFASAVLTAAQVGSNLSEILDSISGTIKDRIRIKQEVRVLTSSGRISGLIIGLLPGFLLLVLMIINPDYISIFFNSKIGNIMLIVSVVLELIGFAVIRKIADIQY